VVRRGGRVVVFNRQNKEFFLFIFKWLEEEGGLLFATNRKWKFNQKKRNKVVKIKGFNLALVKLRPSS